MKKSFLGFVALLIITGCGVGTRDETRTYIKVANSTSSTYRIVTAYVFMTDGSHAILDVGSGIHKGHTKAYNVPSDQCDYELTVDASYNDPGRTTCSDTEIVPCGKTTYFVFNNTTCQ